MNKKTLLILPALFALAACGSNQPATSSQAASSAADSSSSILSLKGYSLTKERDDTKSASYDLKNVITLETLTSITQLTFTSSNTDVATVDAQGVITRVGYGSASIAIKVAAEPESLWKISSFQISFSPDESYILGKYDCHLDAPQGKTEAYVTMELKANNTFTLTYTAGTVLDYEDSYDVEAMSVDGTYTVDSLYYFTVTTASFPYKKTFSGKIEYPEGKDPMLRLKVPLAAEKLSKIHAFEKDK